MELFDKKFVHFMWDDELEGKKCLVSDDIEKLKQKVENDYEGKIVVEGTCDFPFQVDDLNKHTFRFAYHDPNFSIKKAFNEGKTIQYQLVSRVDWADINSEEALECRIAEGRTFRIKPEEEKPKRMTYRQLAEWLAKGKGQYTPLLNKTFVSSAMDYDNALDDKELPEGYKIRYWGCDEWIEPTEREYLVAVKHTNPDMLDS